MLNKKLRVQSLYIMLFFILIIILLTFFSMQIYLHSKSDSQVTTESLNYNQNSFKGNSIMKIEIKDRVTVETVDKIAIGKSKKEIENEYFDIKIDKKTNNKLTVYFNKLIKTNLIVDKIFVDSSYLHDFILKLNEKYYLCFREDEMTDLINMITYVFDGIRFSRDSQMYICVDYTLEKYRFCFTKENNMLKLTITYIDYT